MFAAQQITILGTGLLGGSIGLGLRARGWKGRIVGFSRRHTTLQTAQQLGCIDHIALDFPHAIRDSQLVILATPISAFESLISQLAQQHDGNRVITDVGSTKQYVIELARRSFPPAMFRRFVGSHPMAGAETNGPQAARAELFANKPCLLTPDSDTNPHAVELVQSLWRTLGMRIQVLTAEEHDRIVARISHLPHAVAATLMQLAAEEGGLNAASTGFKDTTRVAGGEPQVWTDIFSTNRQAVLASLDAYLIRLQNFRQLLESGNRAQLHDFLLRSRQQRENWLKGQWTGGDE